MACPLHEVEVGQSFRFQVPMRTVLLDGRAIADETLAPVVDLVGRRAVELDGETSSPSQNPVVSQRPRLAGAATASSHPGDMANQGIFCLEGEWDDNLADKLSVRPGLDMLTTMRRDRLVHRNAVTKDEFEYFLTK